MTDIQIGARVRVTYEGTVEAKTYLGWSVRTSSGSAHLASSSWIEVLSPPATPEPTGAGAIVKDANGDAWQRTGDQYFGNECWMLTGHPAAHSYEEISQPVTVLDPGAEE